MGNTVSSGASVVGDAGSDASFLERVEDLVDGHATEAIWQRHKREQDEQRGRAILRALIEEEPSADAESLAAEPSDEEFSDVEVASAEVEVPGEEEEEAPLDASPIDLPPMEEEEPSESSAPASPPEPEVIAESATPSAKKSSAKKVATIPEPTFLAFSAGDVDSVMGNLFQEDSDASPSDIEEVEGVESSEADAASEADVDPSEASEASEASGGILAGVASFLPESPEGWIKLGLGVVAGLGVLHLATRSKEPAPASHDMFNEPRFARHCGYCGAPDHDMRNCPARAARTPRLPPRKR
jgi:hypothetical protein